jgi:hypothetical protein
MLDQVIVEGGRPTFLTPNNDEIGQHPCPCIFLYVLVQTFRVPGTLHKGLSGYTPDSRGEDAFAPSDETHPCFSTDEPFNMATVGKLYWLAIDLASPIPTRTWGKPCSKTGADVFGNRDEV